MPSVYDLKPAFQKLLRPLVTRMARWGVTANQLTVTGCVLSLLFAGGLVFLQGLWIWLPVFLLVRMALNAMDGMLAREHGQKSALGAILNEVADVVSDAALLLPLAYRPGWDALWTGAAIFASALTEVTGLAALAEGLTGRYEGPFGKSDRAVALGAIGVAIAMDLPVPGRWILAVWVLLCCVTIINRLRCAIRDAAPL